jgi:hypothetical protein
MAIEGFQNHIPRRIRLGMVGGGKDAFIGAVHRIAARIDDSTNWSPAPCPRRRRRPSRRADLGLAADRAYGDFSRWPNARPG